MDQSQRDWTSLPPEIIAIILRRLTNTTTDRRRLRGVCTSWRTSLTPSKSFLEFPFEIPLPPQFHPSSPGSDSDSQLDPASLGSDSDSDSGLDLPNFHTGSLIQSAFYLISGNKTTHPTSWLTRVEETSESPPNYWSLLNPMSRDRLFQPMPNIKGTVSFLDHNISEIARSYSLFTGDFYDDVLKVVKIVVFPRNGAVLEEGFSLLALFGNGDLGLWKYGGEEWKTVPKINRRFGDVIVYENEFYVTDLKGTLMVINPVTFEARDVIASNVDGCDGMFTYLVESNGKLYLVNKEVNTKAGFEEVLYPDPETKKMARTKVYCEPMQPMCLGVWVLSKGGNGLFWDLTWSLDDRVFFVSEYVTFSVSRKELGWKRGDYIFFNEEGFRGHLCSGYGFGSDDECDSCDHTYESELQLFSRNCGIFYVQKGAITTTSDDRLPWPFKIFWPVPKWLISDQGQASLE